MPVARRIYESHPVSQPIERDKSQRLTNLHHHSLRCDCANLSLVALAIALSRLFPSLRRVIANPPGLTSGQGRSAATLRNTKRG